MKVICAWCGKDLGEKEPLENKDTSHGICKKCKEIFFEEELCVPTATAARPGKS